MTTAAVTCELLSVGAALAKTEPELAAAHLCLYGWQLGPLAWDSDLLSISFTPAQAPNALLHLLLRCGGHDFQLQVVDPNAVADFSLLLSPALPTSLQLAAVTHLLHPLIERWSSHWHQRVELLAVAGPEPLWPGETALGLQLERTAPGGTRRQTSAQLRTSAPESWHWLVKMLQADVNVSFAEARPDPTVLLTLRIERLPLSVRELAGMMPGDVLLLNAPASSLQGLSVQLWLGRSQAHVANACMASRVVEITNVVACLPDAGNPRWTNSERQDMQAIESGSESHASIDPDSESGNITFESLMLELAVEAGRIALPLSAIRTLSVGQVYTTDAPVRGRNVSLWCCGQQVAVGELMAVGDRLGVRIAAVKLVQPDASDRSDPALSDMAQTP